MSTNTLMTQEQLDEIMAAWMNPGPHPGYHRAMQAEVHRTMPVLAAALERAALDMTRRRPAHRPEIRPTTDDESGAERQRPRLTVDEDMVERAARAMCDIEAQADQAMWDKLDEDERDVWRIDARAALDAALGTGEGS